MRLNSRWTICGSRSRRGGPIRISIQRCGTRFSCNRDRETSPDCALNGSRTVSDFPNCFCRIVAGSWPVGCAGETPGTSRAIRAGGTPGDSQATRNDQATCSNQATRSENGAGRQQFAALVVVGADSWPTYQPIRHLGCRRRQDHDSAEGSYSTRYQRTSFGDDHSMPVASISHCPECSARNAMRWVWPALSSNVSSQNGFHPSSSLSSSRK